MQRDEIRIESQTALGGPGAIFVSADTEIRVPEPFKVVGRMKRIEADRPFEQWDGLFGAVGVDQHRTEIGQRRSVVWLQ